MRNLSAGLLLGSIAMVTGGASFNAFANDALIERGEYLFIAANCYACHTNIEKDGEPLAGGRALESDFGTFYTPNITPDKKTGIGNWTDTQFVNAMVLGESPEGRHYYPSFPYLSYRDMSKKDLRAIKAYIFTLEPVEKPNRAHELKWFLNQFTIAAWKLLNDVATEPIDGTTSRGAYMINTLGHCNECHTPRNEIGMLLTRQRLQGNKQLKAPDISPTANGVGDWSYEELENLFRYGELKDGDYVADHMGEVVDYSTSKWTRDDLDAAIEYLQQGH